MEDKYYKRTFFIWMASWMVTVAEHYGWACNDNDIMCMARCIKGLMYNTTM